MLAAGSELIPTVDLASKGREHRPHLTLKYGVTEDTAALQGVLSRFQPFKVTLGKTIVFPPNDSTDGAAVVVVEARGQKLKQLRAAIAEKIGAKDDDFEYTPHITLAYVKPETAEKYQGSKVLDGTCFLVRSVTLCGKQNGRWKITLGTASKAAKAGGEDDDEIEGIIGDLLGGFDEIPGPISHELAATFLRQARELRDGFGAEDKVELSLLNQAALDFARERGAELVGRRWVGGRLIANPDARWAITDTTRDRLKELLGRGFSEGLTPRQVEGLIEQSGLFGEARAHLIAKTEMANAQSKGGKATAKEVGAIAKSWEVSGDHDIDDECNGNEDDGVIGIDEAFSSGDDTPTAHPGCNCATVYYTADDPEAEDFAPSETQDEEGAGAEA